MGELPLQNRIRVDLGKRWCKPLTMLCRFLMIGLLISAGIGRSAEVGQELADNPLNECLERLQKAAQSMVEYRRSHGGTFDPSARLTPSNLGLPVRMFRLEEIFKEQTLRYCPTPQMSRRALMYAVGSYFYPLGDREPGKGSDGRVRTFEERLAERGLRHPVLVCPHHDWDDIYGSRYAFVVRLDGSVEQVVAPTMVPMWEF